MPIFLLQKRLTATFTEDEARLMVAAVDALQPWRDTSLSASEYDILQGEKHHRIAIRGDHGGEVDVVKGGPRRAYLWSGHPEGRVVTISGEKTLRKLALAILAEVGR